MAPLPTFIAHFDKKRPFQGYMNLLSKSKFWQFFQNYWLVFSCIWILSGAFRSPNVCLWTMKRRSSWIHASRGYGTFYSILEITIKVVITETVVESLFFASVVFCSRCWRSSITILSLISFKIVQKLKKNLTCKVWWITL